MAKKKIKYIKPEMKFNPGMEKYEVDLDNMEKKHKKQQVCELCGDKTGKCTCKKEKPLKVYFCPKCKSTDVGFVFRFQNLFGLLPRIVCKKCNYSSGMFPIAVIPKSKLNKLNKKEENKKARRKK